MLKNIKNTLLKFTLFCLILLTGQALNAQQCAIGIGNVGVSQGVNNYFLEGVEADDIYYIYWTDLEGNILCSNATHDLEDGEEITLCAEYSIENDEYGYCSNTTCRTLGFDDCATESLVVPFSYCDEPYEPVCGCDGITYANACEAEEYFGITQYSQGSCLPDSICTEELTYFYPQNLQNGSFEFINLCHGTSFAAIWRFGDGSASEETVQVQGELGNTIYTYTEPGAYVVSLTRTNYEGITDVFKTFAITNDFEDMCDVSSCVMPGDTDGDMYANVYDVLNLGVAYSSEGSHRPNPNDYWSPQVASNWYETVNGVDYKHADANGDGIINGNDISVIDDNYCYNNDVDFSEYSTEAPSLYLEFDETTIIITDDSPDHIYIEADILIGSNTNVLYDFYGLAFALEYEQEFIADHVTFDYYDQSFMGSVNEIFTLQKEYFVGGQLDIGISRNNGDNQPGYGLIGRVGWIIESDIIEGRATADFEVNIDKVKMINNEGIKLDVNPQPGVITFVDSTTATSLDPILDAQSIHVYPNPVLDQLMIELDDDVKIEAVSVFNTSGSLMFANKVNKSTIQIDMSNLVSGVYMVEIQTAFGVVNRRVVVSK